MHREEIIKIIKDSISSLLEKKNLDLVELNCFYQGDRLTIRLFVDKPEGGISIDECADINRQLGDVIDKENLISENYVLEVSSPGVGRQLKERKDFLRVINKRLDLVLFEPILGKKNMIGRLLVVSNDSIKIEVDGVAADISLKNIAYAAEKL